MAQFNVPIQVLFLQVGQLFTNAFQINLHLELKAMQKLLHGSRFTPDLQMDEIDNVHFRI